MENELSNFRSSPEFQRISNLFKGDTKQGILLEEVSINQTSTETKQFNFNLPEDLKDHLTYISTANGSTISQYLINLIKTDMKFNGIDIKNIEWNSITDGADLNYVISWISRNSESVHKFYVSDKLDGRIYKEFFERIKDKADSIMEKNKKSYQAIICHPVMQRVMESFFGLSDIRIIVSSNPFLLSNIVIVLNKTNSALGWKGGFLTYSLRKTDFLKNKMPDEYGDYFYNQKLINDYVNSTDFENYMNKNSKYKIIEKTLTNGVKVFSVEITDAKKGYVGKNTHYYSFESALAVINEYKRTDVLRQRFSHVLDGSLKPLFLRCINYDTLTGNFAPMKVKKPRNQSPVQEKYKIKLFEFEDMDMNIIPELRQIEALFSLDDISEEGVAREVVHLIA